MSSWWKREEDRELEKDLRKVERREEQRDRQDEQWKKEMKRDEKREEKRAIIPGVPTPIEPPAQQTDVVPSALPKVPDFNNIFASIASGNSPMGVFWALVVLVWVLFGIAGFVMSLWCIGFTGNFGEKFIGIVIAIILGPWYWLYFYSVPSYCARLPPPLF
jgi:hypothetical protein